jgi:hypothetical protein
VATDSAGTATSAAASLLVISPLFAVTLPGDYIVDYAPDTTRGYPGGEAPSFAIDGTTSKYLHFGNNPIHELGFVTAPSQGRSIVTALRLTAANDAPDRRPANVILEGSNDAGANYTLIYSNSISIVGPDVPGGQALDPLTQTIGQVRFENTNSYTSYRWYTTQLQGNVDLMQIGEVELLGVIDTTDPSPYFIVQPMATAAYEQSSAYFNVYALGTPAPDYVWQKGTNGVFVDLADGGNITGSHSDYMTIDPVGFGDAADYRCLASNTAGSIPSAVVSLTVVSTNVDVTLPEDPITSFGDEGGGRYGADGGATNIIDNFNTIIYINAGSGISAAAGFPPFQGPVGVVVTPSVGYTRLSGLRIYTSTEGSGRDPIDYILEGSNDAGANYDLISQGDLDLPLARGTDLYAFDPLQQPMQELLFTSGNNYSTYRLTFNHTRDDATQSALSVGEIELLGVASGPPEEQPVLSIVPNGSGGFTIDSTISGNVYSATNLSGTVIWTLEGPTPLSVTPVPTDTQKYYQIQP